MPRLELDALLEQLIGRTQDVVATQGRLRGLLLANQDARLASLTDRERQVLALIADGLSNREIGERLHLSEKTVKNYVSGLFSKLGMQRRTQAAVYGADVWST